MNASERVRLALKHRLDRLGITNRAFAKLFSANGGKGHGDQWASHLLSGKFSLSLDELDEAARAVKVSPTDLVKVDYEEAMFLAPLEQRLIRAMRDLPPAISDHILTLAEYLVGVAPAEIDHLMEFRRLSVEGKTRVQHWTHAALLSEEPMPGIGVPDDPIEKGARPTAEEQRIRLQRRKKNG